MRRAVEFVSGSLGWMDGATLLTLAVAAAFWGLMPQAWGAGEGLLLVDPKAPLSETWTHRTFGTATEYASATVDGRPAIRAVGRNSASGLYRKVGYRVTDYPWLEWVWRVERLQSDADIRTKAGQDFAAAIFLIFKEQMLFMEHQWVLSYVWTNGALRRESIVRSPYHPDVSRSVVVESGRSRLGQWVRERRNLADDYRRAFGRNPPEFVSVIALFTDNDQTGQPVEAYYGTVRALRE